MEYIVSASEMRDLDRYTIDCLGVPAAVLMERAALAIATEVLNVLPAGRTVFVLCGTGNNGGDGLAVVRILAEKGIPVRYEIIGNSDKLSEDAFRQYTVLRKMGLMPTEHSEVGECGVYVDALFGTGLTRPLEGVYAEAVEWLNERKGYVIAADIPSGIDSDSGKVCGVAVKADVTVTMQYRKKGLVLYPGCTYAGHVITADIGISKLGIDIVKPGVFTCEPFEAIPKRNPSGNKGTFGKLLIIGGAKGMCGAAILAAKGAVAAGAGMVKVFVHANNTSAVNISMPSVMTSAYGDEDFLTYDENEQLINAMKWADAAVIGCGLGKSEKARSILKTVCDSSLPIVIDGDGLRLLAEADFAKELCKLRGERGLLTVLTPHMGELAGLLGRPTEEVCADEQGATREACEQYGVCVVGKSARTTVQKIGEPIFLNLKGNDKMATAGSGDVLAGMIGGFLSARRIPEEERNREYKAAIAGVSLHAMAGDLAAAQTELPGMSAADIADTAQKADI